MTIDVAFDFRADTPGYPRRDPDRDSPTLHRYHKLLWSKALPSGEPFDLTDARPGGYLRHHSELGEFWLSSDSAIQTFTRVHAREITERLPTSENEAFFALAYTIGGMTVFPSNQVDGQWTINQARGCLKSIADRFDLTLECIRRHYANESSPLAETISRYAEFFALFTDFRGYVTFFLLDDLVTDECTVKFFMPFVDFESPAVPQDVHTYLEFRRRSIEFIVFRNHRIRQLGL